MWLNNLRVVIGKAQNLGTFPGLVLNNDGVRVNGPSLLILPSTPPARDFMRRRLNEQA